MTTHYENGPQGMPRVERMTDSTIMAVLSQKNVPTIYVHSEQDYTSLRLFAHAIAEETLARVPSWPKAERTTSPVSQMTDEMRSAFMFNAELSESHGFINQAKHLRDILAAAAPHAQAPAEQQESIDTPEFHALLHSTIFANGSQYVPSRQALIAHIDAKLAQARQEVWVAERAAEVEARDRDEWKARATAAEAKLEAIRQGVDGLTRWDDNLGMCPVDYGPWIARTEVLSLLQPQEPEPEPKVKYIGGPVEVRITRYKLADPAQPQADESGLPG